MNVLLKDEHKWRQGDCSHNNFFFLKKLCVFIWNFFLCITKKIVNPSLQNSNPTFVIGFVELVFLEQKNLGFSLGSGKSDSHSSPKESDFTKIRDCDSQRKLLSW